VVGEAAHPDAKSSSAANVDDDLSDQIWVTVVATRFGRPAQSAAARAAAEPTIRRTKDAGRRHPHRSGAASSHRRPRGSCRG